MTLTSMLEVFLAGFGGGMVIEVVHWYAIRKDGNWPTYANSVGYWLLSFVMAVLGGGLAILYFGGRAEGLVAFHVGISAPLILQKLTTTIAAPGAKGASGRLITFFHW